MCAGTVHENARGTQRRPAVADVVALFVLSIGALPHRLLCYPAAADITALLVGVRRCREALPVRHGSPREGTTPVSLRRTFRQPPRFREGSAERVAAAREAHPGHETYPEHRAHPRHKTHPDTIRSGDGAGALSGVFYRTGCGCA